MLGPRATERPLRTSASTCLFGSTEQHQEVNVVVCDGPVFVGYSAKLLYNLKSTGLRRLTASVPRSQAVAEATRS